MTMDILSFFVILFGIIPHAALEFTCTRGGRLKNTEDTTSRSYYLCRKLRNGTYISKLYQCPGSTFFNPEIELCSADYKPETDFQCSRRGRFHDPTDEYCQRYYLCSTLSNGTFVKTLYTCPKTSHFDPSLGRCSFDYRCPAKTTTDAPIGFVCGRKGRFKDPEDISCTIYYLCSQLRNGTFIQTKYKCPSDSFFHPDKEMCTTGYFCLDGSITATTSVITNDVISTTNTIKDPLTTDKAGDTSASSTSSDSMVTGDKSPNISVDDNYTTSSSDDNSNNNHARTSPNSMVTDSKSNTNSNSSNLMTTDSDGGGDGETPSKSSDSITTDGIISTASTIPVPTTTEDEFTCMEKGRFQDAEDATCKNYFLCSELRNGTFIKTKYVCPKNSRFDPEARVCSSFYTCPRSTTQAGGTTKKQCRGVKKGPRRSKAVAFTCSEKGRFRDPDDNTCELYYLCSRLHNGAFVPTKYRCPEGSCFDPELGRCSAVYVCLGSTTPSAEVEDCGDSGDNDYTEKTGRTKRSNQTAVYTDGDEEDGRGGSTRAVEGYTSARDGDDFFCTDKGRFPDLTDVNCERYFLCSRLFDGTFIKTMYKCPNSTYFDPVQEKCSPVFQCWDLSSTSKSFEYWDYSDSDYTAEILMSTVDSEEGSVITESTLDLDYFVCTHEGRYSDPKDSSCMIYYLCSQLRNGTFIPTKFQCPINTFFNPASQTCSHDYQCPYKTTPMMDYDSSEISTEEDESMYTDGDGDDYSLLTTRFGNSSPLFVTTTSDEVNSTKENDSSKPSTEEDVPMRTNDNDISGQTRVSRSTNTDLFNKTTTKKDNSMELSTMNNTVSHDTTLSEISSSTVTATKRTTNEDIVNKTAGTLPSDGTSESSIEGDSSTQTTGDQVVSRFKNSDSTGISRTTTADAFNTTENPLLTTMKTSTEKDGLMATIDDNDVSHKTTDFENANPEVTLISRTMNTDVINHVSSTINKDDSSKPSTEGNDTPFLTTRFGNARNSTILEDFNSLQTSSSDNATINTILTEPQGTTTSAGDEFECQSSYSVTHYDFNCEHSGRFADPNDSTMKRYFLCSKIRNGTFMQTLFQCPKGTIFNQTISKCRTASFKSTTLCPTDNTDIQTTYHPTDFRCEEEGRFPDLTDETSTLFFECTLIGNQTFNMTKYACPQNLIFDPFEQMCLSRIESSTKFRTKRSDDGYSSTIAYTEITNTTNTDVMIGHTVGKYFACKARGYYKNHDDPTGVSYYYCDIASDGRLFQYLLTCPNSYFYNDENNLCTPLKANMLAET